MNYIAAKLINPGTIAKYNKFVVALTFSRKHNYEPLSMTAKPFSRDRP